MVCGHRCRVCQRMLLGLFFACSSKSAACTLCRWPAVKTDLRVSDPQIKLATGRPSSAEPAWLSRGAARAKTRAATSNCQPRQSTLVSRLIPRITYLTPPPTRPSARPALRWPRTQLLGALAKTRETDALWARPQTTARGPGLAYCDGDLRVGSGPVGHCQRIAHASPANAGCHLDSWPGDCREWPAEGIRTQEQAE